MKTNFNEHEILLVNFIKKMEKNMDIFYGVFFLCCIIITIICMNSFMIKFEIASLIISLCFLLMCFYILYKIEVKFSKKQIKHIIDYELKNFDGVLIFNIDKTVKDKKENEYMYIVRNLYKNLKITEPDFDFYLTFQILRNYFEIKFKVPEKYMVNDRISFISSDDFKKDFLPFMNL